MILCFTTFAFLFLSFLCFARFCYALMFSLEPSLCRETLVYDIVSNGWTRTTRCLFNPLRHLIIITLALLTSSLFSYFFQNLTCFALFKPCLLRSVVDSLSGKKFGSQDVSNIPTWTVFLSSPPLFGTISVENKILAPPRNSFYRVIY